VRGKEARVLICVYGQDPSRVRGLLVTLRVEFFELPEDAERIR
jgi:hypothetical protein